MRLREIAPLLIDERFGIVRSVVERRRESGSPDFFHFVATAANTAALGGERNFAIGAGASTTRDGAMAKAIGEAIERYGSALYRRDDLPLTTAANASFPCIDPNDIVGYAPWQYAAPNFGYVPFTPHTPVRWAPGTDLLTHQRVFVPAALVYVPYSVAGAAREAPIAQPISTGLACHESLARATIGAICETIERDAFMLTWQAQIGPPRIPLESLPPAGHDLVERFVTAGRHVALFDLTYDSRVTTILAALDGRSPRQPALVVAAAAALRPLDALRASLEELALTGHYMDELRLARRHLTPHSDYSNVTDQRSHLLFWCDPARRPLADGLFAGRMRRSFTDLEDASTGDPDADVAVLTERIAATGHRVIRCDLTPADVGSLGLHVVRTVIPGFHPLRIGFGNRALGGTRLWTVPQRLGYRGIDPERGDYAVPHPYP